MVHTCRTLRVLLGKTAAMTLCSTPSAGRGPYRYKYAMKSKSLRNMDPKTFDGSIMTVDAAHSSANNLSVPHLSTARRHRSRPRSLGPGPHTKQQKCHHPAIFLDAPLETPRDAAFHSAFIQGE